MKRYLSQFVKGVKLLPMPKLSPTMTCGTVNRWHIAQGAVTKPYQLVVEISTNTLTKLGNNEETIMDIEIIEDAILVKTLVDVGESVKVGSPIAVFCEESDEILNSYGLQFHPDDDVYASPQGIPMALWQAYVQ